jgi:hypothetical protein
MKKLALVVALILITSVAFAQEWHTANQTTVCWDGFGDDVGYALYLANAQTDPQKTNPAKIADDVMDTRYTITLGVEGCFYVGVQSRRYVDGEIVGVSDIAWSDNPEVCLGGATFGICYFLAPPMITGLKVE